jgi:hypothetical protein
LSYAPILTVGRVSVTETRNIQQYGAFYYITRAIVRLIVQSVLLIGAAVVFVVILNYAYNGGLGR